MSIVNICLISALISRSATSLSKANSLSDPMIPTVPPYVKSGVFRTMVESRTPISFLNVTGDTWYASYQMSCSVNNQILLRLVGIYKNVNDDTWHVSYRKSCSVTNLIKCYLKQCQKS